MKFTHLTAVITFIAIAGCNINGLEFNDVKTQDLTPGVAIPLGTSTYTIEELFKDIVDDTTIFNNDSSQLIVFSYYDTSVFELGQDIVSIEDITSEGGLNPNLNVTAGATPLTFPISKEFVFEYPATNEEQLDSVYYASGLLSYNVTSHFECDVDFTFTIENTINTSTEEPVSFTESFTYSGTSPITSSQQLSLPGHKTVLSREGNTNIFRARIEGNLTVNTGQGVNPNDSLEFELIYSNQDFESIFGYFGQDTVNVKSSSIVLDFLESASGDGIYFKAPEINFTFTNSFGLPIGLDLEGVYAKNSSEDSLFLTGSGVSSPFVITMNEDDYTTPEISNYSITANNSNLQNLLQIGPNEFFFPIVGYSNYQTTEGPNYLTQESTLESVLEFSMPLEIRLDDFEQSISFNIADSYTLDEPDSVALIINTVNDLPFTGEMTLEILDDVGNLLYLAASGIVIKPPSFNILGQITSPGIATNSIVLNSDGLEALKVGTEIRAVFTLNTPSSNVNDFFAVYANDQLTVNLSLAGSATIKL